MSGLRQEMPEDGRRRVALIGTGHRGASMWGRDLLSDFRSHVDLVGLADINSMRLEQARVAIGTNAPAFTDLGELIVRRQHL